MGGGATSSQFLAMSQLFEELALSVQASGWKVYKAPSSPASSFTRVGPSLYGIQSSVVATRLCAPTSGAVFSPLMLDRLSWSGHAFLSLSHRGVRIRDGSANDSIRKDLGLPWIGQLVAPSDRGHWP